MSKQQARIQIIALAALLLLTVLTGCDRPEQETLAPAAQSVSKNTVALVGGKPLTQEELREYLDRRPPTPGKDGMKAALRQRLGELIADEILVSEARRLGIDQNPEIRRTIRRMLTQKLLFDQVERPAAERKIEEQELQTYYQTHADAFSRPEQLRLGTIFFTIPEAAKDEDRAARRQEAEKVLDKALKAGRHGFADLSRAHSDPHPRHPLGDSGYFDRQGRPAGLDPALVKQAFVLDMDEQVHDRLIETREGLYIVLPLVRRPAQTTDFVTAAPIIERRIRRQGREHARNDYIAGLERAAGVELFDEQIKKLAAELTVSAPEQGRPVRPQPKNEDPGMAPPRFPAR